MSEQDISTPGTGPEQQIGRLTFERDQARKWARRYANESQGLRRALDQARQEVAMYHTGHWFNVPDERLCPTCEGRGENGAQRGDGDIDIWPCEKCDGSGLMIGVDLVRAQLVIAAVEVWAQSMRLLVTMNQPLTAASRALLDAFNAHRGEGDG